LKKFLFLKITFKSSPLKPLNQIKPNLAGMVPGWVPFKIVSDSPALHSRWRLIEQFWPFEEISIFSNGGHLGYRTALKDTILKGTHPGTIPARFGLIWFCGFRGEDLLLLKIEISAIVHCCFSISQNELKFQLQLHGKE
jgi:hypothetical protein